MEQLLTTSDYVAEIEIEKIRVNPHQPRRTFSEEDLQDLATSIRTVGIIHPPLVRPLNDGSYELVSGERRFRATQLAGLNKIPVLIRTSDEITSAQAALIENIQRVDLNPIDIAASLRKLMDEFGLTQEELATRIGKKRSSIANYLRLLNLPATIQEGLRTEKITMGHAKPIAALTGFDMQLHLYEKITREELSVRQTEECVNQILKKQKRRKIQTETRDFFLEQIGDKLQNVLGTRVTISGSHKRGRISIDYYNLDDLDRLMELLGLNKDRYG